MIIFYKKWSSKILVNILISTEKCKPYVKQYSKGSEGFSKVFFYLNKSLFQPI